MLVRLASKRLMGRELLRFRPSFAPKLLRGYRMVGELMAGEFKATGDDTTLGASCLPSHSARHRSVRLRHIVSAFRRTWRSDAVTPLMIAAAENVVPCGPALPVNAASCRASEAVASKVR